MNFSKCLPRSAAILLWIVGLLLCSIASSSSLDEAFDRDIANESRLRSKDSYGNLLRSSQQQDRQLIFGIIDNQCEGILNATIENIFPRQDCACNAKLIPPSIAIDCKLEASSNRTLCFPPTTKIVCGQPGISVSFNILNLIRGALPVAADLCFYDGALFGLPFPNAFNPFCINLLGSIPGLPSISGLIQAIFGIFLPGSKAGLSADASSSSDTTGACAAKLGNQECQSCTVCSASVGGGVLVDCSNLVPNFVIDECTVLPSFMVAS
jgi:hypothetical protein